jgi:hypothetical protein
MSQCSRYGEPSTLRALIPFLLAAAPEAVPFVEAAPPLAENGLQLLLDEESPKGWKYVWAVGREPKHGPEWHPDEAKPNVIDQDQAVLKKEPGEPGFTAALAWSRARLRPDTRTT